MRRLVVEEPITRAAVWSLRIGWFALAVTAIGVLLVRLGRVDLAAGFAVLAAGLLLALLALALAIVAFSLVWMEGRRGLSLAVKGFVIAVALLAWPGYLAVKAVVLPQLNDVSTDIDDPPSFSRSRAALAARDGRVPGDVPAETRQRQRTAYPAVVPLYLDLAPEEAYEMVRKAATVLGWQVVDSALPGGRIGIGRLDAIDRTLIMRFPDDITVRLRPRADGTRIDVRSASRYGQHDFGANAARITRFLEEVSAQATGK
jgi:uncharacterized protein (DUF1499 family)